MVMTKDKTGPVPTEIKLHRRARVLEIAFDDGARFELPCEYLRVFSPSAEVRAATNRGEVVTGKEAVNVTAITPVGTYAVQLAFDDGHDSGIYSWSTLYELGINQKENWRDYLDRLAGKGHARSSGLTAPPAGPIKVRILYFATLASALKREAEEAELPVAVTDVQALVAWLRGRGAAWERALTEPALKVTVNKQFATPATPLRDGDEIALVAARPV